MRILTIIFIFLSLSSFAQNNTTLKNIDFRRHEIRLILESFDTKYFNHGYHPPVKITPKLLYGVGYDFNFKSLGIRFKGLYQNDGQSSNNKFTLGGFYKIKYGRLTFITGVNSGYFSYNEERTLVKGTVIEAFIGMKVSITKLLSLNFEGQTNFGWLDYNYTYNVYSPIGGNNGQGYVFSTSREKKGIGFFSPPKLFSISLNFNF